jgi:hypothetical protein
VDHQYVKLNKDNITAEEYSNICEKNKNKLETAYKAVTQDVPKSFVKALHDPVWGEPSRVEWNTLIETKALVEVDKKLAYEEIKNGADLVILFPVYEEKIKDGILVKKVRLVGNGKTHYNAGDTYAPTPSREELFVLLHIAAMMDWDYVHLDEKRAFLNAKYKGKNKVFTKLRGDSKMYAVEGALYGLKTSPKDYGTTVRDRFTTMGFTRLHLCSCVFIKRDPKTNNILIIYDFVDDFIIFGNNTLSINQFINEFRLIVQTTEPIWNATSVLGMTLTRDRTKKIILIKLDTKISELGEKYELKNRRVRYQPMPRDGYLVNEYEFDDISEEKKRFLDEKETELYMQIVGSLIWITGVRKDIIFNVMYLSWFTKAPRMHHLIMAYYVMTYLYNSIDIPLVLGGEPDIHVNTYSDASLGTAPKGRSIRGEITSLNEKAGAIIAKSTSSQSVFDSSFGAELDGVSSAIKTMLRVLNILTEMGFTSSSNKIYSDNEAMINFIKGNSVAKGIRHLELRLWYVREEISKGNVDVFFKPGKDMPADQLTKILTRAEFEIFRDRIQGLKLLAPEKDLQEV